MAGSATWRPRKHAGDCILPRPPYSVHTKRMKKISERPFCPLLEKYNVDLVFNGHDHGIART